MYLVMSNKNVSKVKSNKLYISINNFKRYLIIVYPHYLIYYNT